MIINNSIISSIDSLRTNFDFVEIWDKRDIALRDLSPDRILYPDNLTKFLYGVFAHPESATLVEGMLVHPTKDKEGNEILNPIGFDTRHPALAKFTQSERIQIVALFSLGSTKFDASAIWDITATEVSFADDKVTLTNGQTLECSKQPASQPLSHKAIIVAPSSKKPSKVGGYTLQPGQATYGVFSGTKLIAIAPPYAANNSFRLEYKLEHKSNGDDITLEVFNTCTNTIVARYSDGHFYTLIDENDFVVIDGLTVTSFASTELNNRLRREVKKVKFPMIAKYDKQKSLLTITYEDGSTLEITR